MLSLTTVLVNQLKYQTLLGDWLPEPLLAFLAGGGEPLAEREGEGEADAGAGRFWAAGWGETDLDLEDTLLIGWGLGEGLWRKARVTSGGHSKRQWHIYKTGSGVQKGDECSLPHLPLVVAWFWCAGNSADGFTAVWRGLSTLATWRCAGGFKTSLRTGGAPDSATAVCRRRGEATGCCNRRSCIPAWPHRRQHGASPVSGWRCGGRRCAPPLSRRASALGGPGRASLCSWRRAFCGRARKPPLLWRQRWGAVATLDRGRITSGGWRSSAGRWGGRPGKHQRQEKL